PAIRFAVEGRQDDGWYNMGSLTVKAQCVISRFGAVAEECDYLSTQMLQRGSTIRPCIMAALAGAIALCAPAAEDPRPQSFLVREQPLSPGPRITPFLQYQAEQAWREDDDRQKAWDAIHDQRELLKTQDELRQKLQQMIGGLPA